MTASVDVSNLRDKYGFTEVKQSKVFLNKAISPRDQIFVMENLFDEHSQNLSVAGSLDKSYLFSHKMKRNKLANDFLVGASHVE